MADKYGILTWSDRRTKVVTKYTIVDLSIYPDDVDNFLKDHHEWYRKERLSDMELVTFVVSPYQPKEEAYRRAVEYKDFMNRQYDQMQVAAKLVQL